MTEIKIEKKKPIWPWILGVLALALIAYLLFFRNDDDDENDIAIMNNADTTALVTTPNNNIAAVDDYVAYIHSDTSTMGLDHEYASQALLKLTAATKAVADKNNYDVQANIDAVNEHANIIKNDPTAITHADHIRSAADILSTTLQNLQQSNYPQLNSESEAVKNAADSINPKELTLDQKDAVKSFFDKAADLLTKMN